MSIGYHRIAGFVKSDCKSRVIKNEDLAKNEESGKESHDRNHERTRMHILATEILDFMINSTRDKQVH